MDERFPRDVQKRVAARTKLRPSWTTLLAALIVDIHLGYILYLSRVQFLLIMT